MEGKKFIFVDIVSEHIESNSRTPVLGWCSFDYQDATTNSLELIDRVTTYNLDLEEQGKRASNEAFANHLKDLGSYYRDFYDLAFSLDEIGQLVLEDIISFEDAKPEQLVWFGRNFSALSIFNNITGLITKHRNYMDLESMRMASEIPQPQRDSLITSGDIRGDIAEGIREAVIYLWEIDTNRHQRDHFLALRRAMETL